MATSIIKAMNTIAMDSGSQSVASGTITKMADMPVPDTDAYYLVTLHARPDQTNASKFIKARLSNVFVTKSVMQNGVDVECVGIVRGNGATVQFAVDHDYGSAVTVTWDYKIVKLT